MSQIENIFSFFSSNKFQVLVKPIFNYQVKNSLFQPPPPLVE